ncbi:MAG: hypothetical protein IIZ78_09845 [Clostridiales bacterium]|nr:hypothetical protein [Clostridiales bacterium]
MLKTKFIEGDDRQDLERKLNAALEEIEGKPRIQYFESKWLAVIEHEIEEAYQKRLCSECAHWEDTGNGTLVNFCTQDGKRKRYNCKACPMYKDLRDA